MAKIIKTKVSKSILKRIHTNANGKIKVKKIGRNHHSLKKKNLSFINTKHYLHPTIQQTIKAKFPMKFVTR